MKKLIILLFLQLFLITPSFAQDNEQEPTKFELYIQKQVEYMDLTGFIQATIENDTAHIKKLFENGLKPDDTIGGVPHIFYAIYLDKPQVLDLILSYGGNPNKTCFKESPLHFCIYLKRKNCLNILLQYGADINKKCLGRSALDFAMSKKEYKTALHLLKCGALPSRYTYRKAKKADNIELKRYLGMNVN
ncbi:ankyrin repeat domain-containing protein [bacterium]|nr:ankyrin repeat domain-containing protein [bacterium]